MAPIVLYGDLRNKAAQTRYLKQVGLRIMKARIVRGHTVRTLAYSVPISRQQLYRIEAGDTNTTITVLRRIATLLEVGVEELLNV